MRAAFSKINLIREERASLIAKVTIRGLSAVCVVAIISSLLILKYFTGKSEYSADTLAVKIAALTFICIMLGCVISLIVYALSTLSFRNLLIRISQESPPWEQLDREYMSTDARQLYLSVKKLHDKVSAEVRMATIGRMSSHIAHDMRSPLSVLKQYAEGETEDLTASDREEFQKAAKSSVNKLLKMSNELVDYAKANKLEREKHNIKEIVCNDVLSEIAQCAEKNGAKIECDHVQEVKANVDRYRLGRVLVNLVNNSIQAIPESGGKIMLRVTNKEAHNLHITVSDNGSGIESESLPHIFESFFTRNKKGGTGLGLAFCKQVVEAHGGTIEAESELGKGTKFTINIPDCVVT